MKAIKKILATLLCLCLVWGCVAMLGSAAETGSITIENQSGTNATVAGKTLNLFKIFNATTDGDNISYQWIKETVNGKTVNKYESFFFGDGQTYKNRVGVENGTIHDVVAYINHLKTDTFDFSQMAAELHKYIHDKNIDADKTSGQIASTATSYKFEGLDLGYYMIYDATSFESDTAAVRSAAMLAHPGENKVIKLKADRPHIVKQVDDRNAGATDADWKLGTTASIGDIVSFRIATMVPDHDLYGENYTFIISDTMDNELILDEDSIKIFVDGENKTGDYSVITKGTDSKDQPVLAGDVDFQVNIDNVTTYDKDTVIEVVYDAKVSAEAKDKNVNTAKLTYSNDPNKAGSTGSVDASVTVMLWQFTLTKYMEDANGTPSFIRLPGAEFEIYKKGVDTPLSFAEVSTTKKIDEETSRTYTKYVYDPTNAQDSVTTLKTLDEADDGKIDVGYTDGEYLGQILIWGLGEGTYIIKETKAPNGYQIAKGVFEFTVSDTVGPTGAISNATISETRTEAPGKFNRVSIDETTQKYYIGITNAPGSALPETGGMGTTLFTAIGIILMAGAVAFFTTRKRNSFA